MQSIKQAPLTSDVCRYYTARSINVNLRCTEAVTQSHTDKKRWPHVWNMGSSLSEVECHIQLSGAFLSPWVCLQVKECLQLAEKGVAYQPRQGAGGIAVRQARPNMAGEELRKAAPETFSRKLGEGRSLREEEQGQWEGGGIALGAAGKHLKSQATHIQCTTGAALSFCGY